MLGSRKKPVHGQEQPEWHGTAKVPWLHPRLHPGEGTGLRKNEPAQEQ